MALDYRKCAKEIVDHIGGRENVAQAAHCATRLRLVIKDNSKVDKAYLEEIEGVKGLFESSSEPVRSIRSTMNFWISRA